MKLSILSVAICIAIAGCSKRAASLDEPQNSGTVLYTISAGGHYSSGNQFKAFSGTSLFFKARFDNSAVYSTTDPSNQADINKLYGFSDNNQNHHQYSARIGWCWLNHGLHLYAYVYNEGKMESQEITSIPLNEEAMCSIQVFSGYYLFTVNGSSVQMPRKSSTAQAQGYRLYPYFGGDETAPHDVRIWIEEKEGINMNR